VAWMIAFTLHVIVPHMLLYFSDLSALILKCLKRNKRECDILFIFLD